ncbi:hypothetical protein [Nostoc commune]|nr:hypothetical protein [Nostoc commune]
MGIASLRSQVEDYFELILDYDKLRVKLKAVPMHNLTFHVIWKSARKT